MVKTFLNMGLIQKKYTWIEKGAQINILANKILT